MKIFKLFLCICWGGILFSCDPASNVVDPKPPANLITYEKAFEQLKNFNSAHPGVSGDQYGLRTWVSIEDLENYIAYVKAEGKKAGIEVSGMEFIHTQYKSAPPYQKNFANADYDLTFMYAPTYKDAVSGKNEAFDPMHSQKGKVVKLREVFAKKDSADAIGNEERKSVAEKSPTGKSGVANSLNTCPSVCP